VSIGRLSENLIDSIVLNKPEYLNILFSDVDILFWEDRIAHTERHRKDFKSDEEFNNAVSSIPDIVSSPDYVGVHPVERSISFIKKLSTNILVAVRVSSVGKLSYRTMYPITEKQLSSYIRHGTAWTYEH
jgi:hypothetical protein